MTYVKNNLHGTNIIESKTRFYYNTSVMNDEYKILVETIPLVVIIILTKIIHNKKDDFFDNDFKYEKIIEIMKENKDYNTDMKGIGDILTFVRFERFVRNMKFVLMDMKETQLPKDTYLRMVHQACRY